MTEEHEIEETSELLVARALKNEKFEFFFIRCLDELRFIRLKRKATIKVANSFNKSAKKILSTYIKSLDEGESRYDLLVSYKQVKICADFYYEETKILNDMIKEYKCYMKFGHFWQTLLLNYYRPDEDCIDWRTLPLGW